MAAESRLAEVTAERDFSHAQCAELRLKLSMQQPNRPASRLEQEQGLTGCERQPQPPSLNDRHEGPAATEIDKGKFCYTNHVTNSSEGMCAWMTA